MIVFTPTLTNVMMTKAVREYDKYSMNRLQAAILPGNCSKDCTSPRSSTRDWIHRHCTCSATLNDKGFVAAANIACSVYTKYGTMITVKGLHLSNSFQGLMWVRSH